eukprot:Hpha_TRINITY_DN15790_c2_g2::TRINITY_DN15790_c2_g2_i1::g.38448::m.38448
MSKAEDKEEDGLHFRLSIAESRAGDDGVCRVPNPIPSPPSPDDTPLSPDDTPFSPDDTPLSNNPLSPGGRPAGFSVTIPTAAKSLEEKPNADSVGLAVKDPTTAHRGSVPPPLDLLLSDKDVKEEWEYEGQELTAGEEKGFQLLFNRLDRTMDGSLHRSELQDACALLEFRMTPSQVNVICNMAGCDGQESIQADEFLRFASLLKAVVPPQVWSASSGRKLHWVVTKVLADRDHKDVQEVHRRRHLIEKAMQRPLSSVLARVVIEVGRQLVALYWGLTVPIFLGVSGYHYDFFGGWGIAMLVLECLWTAVAMLDFVAQAVHGFDIYDLKTWADVFATMPLDLVAYAAQVQPLHKVGYGLRLLALIKLLRAQFHPVGLITVRSVKLGLYVLPVIKEALLCVLLLHAIACSFRALNCGESCNTVMSRNQYVDSMYWTLYTISTVGYGDINVDTPGAKILSMVCFMAAIMVNAFLIGRLASYMLLDTDGEQRKLLARTMQVITSYSLPEDLIEDVLSLQNHLLEQKLVLTSFSEVVNTFPPEVQEVLSLYVRVEFLGNIPLFAEASAACKVNLAEGLCKRTVSRGEDIIVEDEAGYCMYVIVHGFAEVHKNNNFLVTLTKGAAFGEMALLSEDNIRAASVRSLTLCEILSLSRTDFDTISGRFPSLRWQIECIMAKRKGMPPPPLREVIARTRLSSANGYTGQSELETEKIFPEEEVDLAIDQHLIKKHTVQLGMADDLESNPGTPEVSPRVNINGKVNWGMMRKKLGLELLEKKRIESELLELGSADGGPSAEPPAPSAEPPAPSAEPPAPIPSAGPPAPSAEPPAPIPSAGPPVPSAGPPAPPAELPPLEGFLMVPAQNIGGRSPRSADGDGGPPGGAPRQRLAAGGRSPRFVEDSGARADGTPLRSFGMPPLKKEAAALTGEASKAVLNAISAKQVTRMFSEILDRMDVMAMQQNTIQSRQDVMMKKLSQTHKSLARRITAVEQSRNKVTGATIGFSRRDVQGERRENERDQKRFGTQPPADPPFLGFSARFHSPPGSTTRVNPPNPGPGSPRMAHGERQSPTRMSYSAKSS